MPLTLLAITIAWIAIIQAFVFSHAYIIETLKKTPFHGLSFLISVALAVAISFYAYPETTFRIVSIIYLGLFFWVLFNLELNLVRNKPALYLGKGSALDRLETRMKNPGATLGMKLTLIVMCVFILLDLQYQP